MRFSTLVISLTVAYTCADAAPQIYGFPFFAPPRPVPGPGITVPSPVKAPQVPRPPQIPRPVPIVSAASPSGTTNSGNANPGISSAMPVPSANTTNPGNTNPVVPPLNPPAPSASLAMPSANSSVTVPTSAAVFSPTSSVPAAAAPTIPIPPTNPGNTAPMAQAQACAADVDRLASGIQQNILDQQGELVTAQGLLLFLQATLNGTRNGTSAGNASTPATTPDKNIGLFMALKGQLLAFVTAGVAIRAGNQAIAPTGSLAANGLAQIANAQQTELALASSLTGDATIDVATVQSLLKAFNNGVKLNMQNLLDATQNCTPTDLIAQRGIQIALRAGLKAVVPVVAPAPAYTPDATVYGNKRRVRRGSAYNYE